MIDGVEFDVSDDPDPDDLDRIEGEVRLAAAGATGLGDQRDLAVLVRADGRLVGGIYGWTWGDACELQSLWIDPTIRGRDLGTRLLSMAEDEAARRGCTQIVIFVHDFQPIALYERFGFSTVGEVAAFPSGSAAIWMRKRVDAQRSAPRHL